MHQPAHQQVLLYSCTKLTNRIIYDTLPPHCLARGTTQQPHGTLGRLARRHGEHGRAFSCSAATLPLLPTRTHTHRHTRGERERTPGSVDPRSFLR